MKTIINKIYIITDDDKKFNKIKYRIGSKKIPIVKVKGIDETIVDDATIDTIASTKCKYTCSNKMISNWFNHYNLWKTIAKNKEDRVLIINDDGMPIKEFSSMLEEYWKEVPKKWDMVYFGCTGSCDSSPITDAAYRIFQSRTNNEVYIDGKKMFYVMEPGFPLGLYGYMLSNEGVQKLIKNEELKKVQNDMDYYLAKEIMDNDDFKVYAFKPSLISYSPEKTEVTNHEILKPITESVQLSKYQSWTNLWNTNIYYIRFLGVDITYFTFVLLLVSLLIGFYSGIKVQRTFLGVLTIIELSELAFSKTSKTKIKNLMFELLLIYAAFNLGVFLKSKANK